MAEPKVPDPRELLRERKSSLNELRTRSPELYAWVRARWIADTHARIAARMTEAIQSKNMVQEMVGAVFDGATDPCCKSKSEESQPNEVAVSCGELLRETLGSEEISGETPLEDLPGFRDILDQAELDLLIEVTHLSTASGVALRGAVPSVRSLDAATLGRLLTERRLDQASANLVGVYVTLSEVTEDQAQAAKVLAVLERRLTDVSLRALARLSPEDWDAALTSAQVDALARDALAARARQAATLAAPGTALLSTIARGAPSVDEDAVERLATVSNPGRDPTYGELFRRYPGLGLHDILLSEGDAADKAKRFQERIRRFTALADALPDLAEAQLSREEIAKARAESGARGARGYLQGSQRSKAPDPPLEMA